jgi:predicted RNase H-like HicB family nuclease
MKFIVTIDRDEDGMFIVECLSIPGCVSQGKTEREAIENIKDAIKECLIVRAERGKELEIIEIKEGILKPIRKSIRGLLKGTGVSTELFMQYKKEEKELEK